MNSETKVALLNWLHTVTDVVQQMAVKHGMPFQADDISAKTRQLVDAIMMEEANDSE